jgi:hypothetical protein
VLPGALATYSIVQMLTFARRTNASPIYLVLFISATYVLNRPCVYCSFLLAILVVALFDFRADWFEPRYLYSPPLSSHSAQNSTKAASPLAQNSSSFSFFDTLSLFGAVMNETAAALANSVAETVKGRAAEAGSAANGTLVEWLRGALRREWRIGCLDVVVRL